MGQVETDEIMSAWTNMARIMFFQFRPKGGADQLGIVQIEQNFALCANKFPGLICCPIAAQFMEDNLIALFYFETTESGIAISDEKHYRLVLAEQLTDEELAAYRYRVKPPQHGE